MTPSNSRADKRATDKIKWASWKQLNRLSRTMAEMLELEFAPDAQTVSALIDRLDAAKPAGTSSAGEEVAF